MAVKKKTLDELAISDAEYEAIVERLGREPNHLELGLFGSLWSEHCGYKHSKPLLRMFDTDSDRLLVAPGSENAGVVDIGEGWAVVMKIESHNHPSAIEPYQGAATGVGGIVRDIFAMGARPIALLNSLRFGPLTEPGNRRLFEGVVSGISGYGNCIGVPDVGGEVYFSPSYTGNPLVNAMCVGLLRHEELRTANAGGAGNLLMLVGADTGRDGIHGASGLASKTFDDDRELRPTVQVGNPFLEKVLIEACLEAARSDAVVGIQDLGAAGLTSASVESAHNAGAGIRIDVANVARRESGMEPYEVMLSESQERMLVVVKRGGESEIEALFDKWDLRSDVIGEVTSDGIATILDDGEIGAQVSVDLLTDPPLYRLQGVKPKWLGRAPGVRPLPPAAAGLDASIRPAEDARLSQRRQQGVDIPPVRSPGADEHRRPSGRRRGASEVEGQPQGVGGGDRRQWAILLPRSLRRRHDRSGRGVSKRVLHGRDSGRSHRLSELRQPRTTGGVLPARERDCRHGRGQQAVRRPSNQRQRQPLQRVSRRGHLPDAGRRGARSH